MSKFPTLTLLPIGTDKALTWGLPREGHLVRRRYDFLAEIHRGDGGATGWLVRPKSGAPLFEITTTVAGGYIQRTVEQDAARKALATMERA